MRKLFLGIALLLSLVLYSIPLRADTITFHSHSQWSKRGDPIALDRILERHYRHG